MQGPVGQLRFSNDAGHDRAKSTGGRTLGLPRPFKRTIIYQISNTGNPSMFPSFFDGVGDNARLTSWTEGARLSVYAIPRKNYPSSVG